MTTFFDEKHGEGGLPLTEDEKVSVLHLPGTGKGIHRRKLRGDRNQCPTCEEYFNSIKAFDQHRTGSFSESTRRCLTVVEMRAMNFRKTKDDFWLSSVSPKDRERLNHFRNGKQRALKKP